MQLTLMPLRDLAALPSPLGISHLFSNVTRNEAGLTPYMRIEPEQVAGTTGELNLNFAAKNFDEPSAGQSALTVLISEPGRQTARYSQAAYNTADNQYKGQISVTAVPAGTHHLQVIGGAGEQVYVLSAVSRLQITNNREIQALFSHDGRLSLLLNPETFPGSQTVVAITAHTNLPGPLPDGAILVGDTYDITASGSILALDRPTAVTMTYDDAQYESEEALGPLDIYWWNPESEIWQPLHAAINPERGDLSAIVSNLGVFAILGIPQS
jgi:hypothetical protein